MPLAKSTQAKIGPWTVTLTTKQSKLFTERAVHLSDNVYGHGKGTLLRTDRRKVNLESHTVDLCHDAGDRYTIAITGMGKRQSVTLEKDAVKRSPEGDSIWYRAKESYTMAKAEALLSRTLRTTPEIIRRTFLTPLPEASLEPVEAA